MRQTAARKKGRATALGMTGVGCCKLKMDSVKA